MSGMEIDISSRLEIARGIASRVTRLAAIDSRTDFRGSDENEQPNTSQSGEQTSVSNARDQEIALPDPATREFAGRLLNVNFVDDTARDEMRNRLWDVKSNLKDLCERQLNDLEDEGSSVTSQPEFEDVDRLIAEMQAVERSMETVVALQQAL